MNNIWMNNKEKTRYLKIDNSNFVPFLKQSLQCGRCSTQVSKPYGSWIGKCKRCKTYISFFAPTPIQQIAGKCESTILFNIGGYGSGKTTISCNIFSSMMRRIPKARMICLAQTLQQLNKNAISELKTFFHPDEIKSMNKESWELTNGGVIEFWPSDDPDKLKSANANFIWIVEGNTHAMQLMYNEALARIRNQKGFIYEYDKHGEIKMKKFANGQIKPIIKKVMNLLLVEANPEKGAWSNKSALTSHTVIHTRSVRGVSILKQQSKPIRHLSEFSDKEENVDIVTILNATIDNPILPESYFTNLKARCRTQEEYDRIVYCDITSQDGLVFKQVVENHDKYFVNVQSIPPKPEIVFVEGLDPGGSNAANDPEAYLLFYFDKQFKQLTLVDGFKISGLTLAESTKKIWDLRNKWGWSRNRFLTFVADNALGRSSKTDNRFSLKTDYELRLTTPILLQNDKNISNGIKKLTTWFDNNAIQISQAFEDVKTELFGYEKFEVAKIVKGTQAVRYVEQYTEVNNHIIDVLRYVIVALEGLGFRQDQHIIDYHQQQAQISYNPQHLRPKNDIRQFLPTFMGGQKINTPKKKLKL